MSYSILQDCGCGFAINGGKNNFCPKHNEIISNMKEGQSFKMIFYRAGIGYKYRVSCYNGLIEFTTWLQEGYY